MISLSYSSTPARDSSRIHPVDPFRCPSRPRAPLPLQGLSRRVWLSSPHRKALPSPHRSYGLMRQTKILSSTSPLAILSSLRRLPLAPAGSWSFPTLSPQSLHGCLDPYPVAFPQCAYPFLPEKLRPHYKTE